MNPAPCSGCNCCGVLLGCFEGLPTATGMPWQHFLACRLGSQVSRAFSCSRAVVALQETHDVYAMELEELNLVQESDREAERQRHEVGVAEAEARAAVVDEWHDGLASLLQWQASSDRCLDTAVMRLWEEEATQPIGFSPSPGFFSPLDRPP